MTACLRFAVPFAAILLGLVAAPRAEAVSTCSPHIPASITTAADLVTAVNQAQSASCPNPDTIDLAGNIITFTSAGFTDGGDNLALPPITTPLSIINGTIVRSGVAGFRFLLVDTGGSLTLTDMTLANGGGTGTSDGGAMRVAGSANLTVDRSTFLGNTAPDYGGGAILANGSGTVLIRDTVLRYNQGGTNGGALNIQGSTVLTVERSRFEGNVAPEGAAIETVTSGAATIRDSLIVGNAGNRSVFVRNNLTLVNTTIAGNRFSALEVVPGFTLVVRNSVVWGNENTYSGLAPTATTYSAVEGLAGATINTGYTAADFFVNPLATPTAANTGLNYNPALYDWSLRPFSPAINAGQNTYAATTDLDGAPRRIEDADVPNSGVGTAPIVDMGAYERQASSCSGFTYPYLVAGATNTLRRPNLRDAVRCANLNGASPDTIDLGGQTVTFASPFATINALPPITTPITLRNGIIERSSVVGTPQFRLIENGTGGTLTVSGMTLRNGHAGTSSTTSVGGAIYSQGTLAIDTSTLSNNVAFHGGALYVATGAQTTVARSTLRDNTSTEYGGAVMNAGTMTLANSTVTGNTSSVNQTGAVQSVSTGNMRLENTTISGNTGGTGGGGLVQIGGSLSLGNSILAGNTPLDCSLNFSGFSFSNPVSNIIVSNSTSNPCGVVGMTHLDVDPQLGSLTGSPAYFPLTATSPAINAGNNGIAGPIDQPGNARIQGGRVDLGSVESPFAGVTTTLAFNAPTSSAAEAAGFGNLLRVTTSDGNPTAAASSVTVSVTGGTATAADYTHTGTITIPAGTAHNALVSIASGITVTNDAVVEANETVELTLSTPTGAVLGTQATTTHSINNDDVAAVTVGDVALAEGNSGTSTMTFTVTLHSAVEGGFMLNYTTTDLTATTADNDYVVSTAMLFFAGNAGETHDITVTINGDTKVEANETFRISFPSALAGVAPGALIITDTATGTITNDDIAAITIADASIVEGNAGTHPLTFTATLDNPVQGGFTVNYATANGTATVADGDYFFSAGTLVFAGTAGETETFTVTLNGDTKVEANETFTVSMNTVSNAAVTITDTATGTITNDDTASLTIADVAITEGNAGTSNMIFTVALDSQVQGGFTVNYATADGTATTADNDYVAATGTLNFTGTAGQTRTFSVVVNGDTKLEANETFTVSLNTVSNPSVDITDTATGTITNNDTASVTIGPVSQPESGTFTFTAMLDNATAAPFSVDWTLAGGTTSAADYVGGVLPPGGTLTFAGTTGEMQTFTVPVFDDAVAEPTETFTIGMANLATTGGFIVGITDTAIGTINDNDSAGYTVDTTATAASITEPSGSTTFTLRLTSQPAGTVVIDIGSTDLTECTATPATFTFNAGNWNAAQTITINVVDDLIADGTQPCAVTITRTGGTASEYSTVPNPANVTVNIADNEVAGITVNPTTIAIDESGGTATFGVNANTAPIGNVSMTLTTNSQCEVDTGTGFGTAAPLMLPAGSTATRTVTVRAINDSVIEGAHTCAIVTGNPVSPTDATYDALGAADVADVTASVADNDVLHTLAAGPGGPEGTGIDPTYTFTVTRSGATGVASSVDYAMGGTGIAGTDYGAIAIGGAGVSGTATTISFAANATTATVTVTVNADSIDEPDFTLDLALSNATADGGAGTGSIAGSPASLVVTDDDAAGYLVDTSATAATIAEPSGATTFSIRLASQPTGTVVLDLGSTDTTECTVSPASVTFAAGNWTMPQTITIAAVDDAIVDGTQPCAAIIVRNAASTSAEYASIANPSDVTVNVTDDDAAGVVVSPTSGLDTTEAGGTASFTVVLASQPTAAVTIAVSSSDTGEGTADTASLAFDGTNWNIAQTVTVAGVDDDVVDGDVAYTIVTGAAASTDPTYAGFDVADVAVTNRDDDTAGILVTPTSGLETTEAGGTASFTVVLASEPTAAVTIPVSSSDTGEGIVDAASLAFDGTNWNIAQTVTITGVDDDVVDGDVAYTIVTGAAASTDPTYAGFDVADVAATNEDDDTLGVLVTPTALTATEGGAGGSYTVVLQSEPTGAVTIAITPDAQVTASVASLTFTPADWNVAQTVAVTAVDDAVAEGNHSGTISHVASGADYAGVAVSDVTVAITDNETAGVSVTPTSGLVTTEAGGTASFGVVLTSAPTADVSIALSSSDTGEGTVAPASLTFTTANWNVAQTATVTGVDDAVVDGDIAYTIVLAPATSADATYAGLDADDVAVSNEDDDTLGVLVSPTALTATEGGAGGSYTVVLQSEPTGAVTIAVSADAQVEATPASLVFTAMDWNVAQTVTVNAVDDAIAEGNHAGTITHAASGADYAGFAVSDVTVAITDNDGASIVVTPTTGLVTTEAGGTATFSVLLASEPTADVTIALSSSDTGEGTVSPAVLVFDAGTWNAAQTVTVTGVDDAGVDGDIAYTIATAPATSTDPAYAGLDADDVSVTNEDDDTASLRIDDVAQAEGDSGNTAFVFTVTLDGAIDGGVTVDYATADDSATAPADYIATSGTLSFDGTDGETQTITVQAVGDTVVEGEETFRVVLSSPSPAVVTLARAEGVGTLQEDNAGAQLAASKRVLQVGTATTPVVYEIVLSNIGDGDQVDDPASDELVDVLPGALVLVDAGASAGALVADVAGNTVRWNGALAAGASVTLTIEADVVATEAGPIANQAQVAYDGDGDGINDGAALSDDPTTPGDDATVFVFEGVVEPPAAVQPLVVPALDLRMLLVLVFVLGVFGVVAVRRHGG